MVSPAKRLSRKRFRALCKRCRAYLASDAPSDWRAFGHYMAIVRANKRAGRGPYTAAHDTFEAHARLAR